jgi:hypothetical protein
MTGAYWLASHSSIQPIMASPPTHFLITKLNKSCQTSPKVVNVEGGNCKVHQNAGVPSRYDTAQPKKAEAIQFMFS